MFSDMTEEMYEDIFLYRQKKLKEFLLSETKRFAYKSSDSYTNEQIVVDLNDVTTIIEKFEWNHYKHEYKLK